MGGKDEKRTPDLDQALDHRTGTFHRILHIRPLEQFVDQHQPFLLIADLFERITDPLNLIEEKALTLADIILHIDVAEKNNYNGTRWSVMVRQGNRDGSAVSGPISTI